MYYWYFFWSYASILKACCYCFIIFLIISFWGFKIWVFKCIASNIIPHGYKDQPQSPLSPSPEPDLWLLLPFSSSSHSQLHYASFLPPCLMQMAQMGKLGLFSASCTALLRRSNTALLLPRPGWSPRPHTSLGANSEVNAGGEVLWVLPSGESTATGNAWLLPTQPACRTSWFWYKTFLGGWSQRKHFKSF